MRAFALSVSLVAGLMLASAPNALADNGPVDWSGFYFGGQAGYVGGKMHFDGTSAGPGGRRDQRKVDGFSGGGHVGFNWQDGNFVAGFVADANFSDLDGSGIGQTAIRYSYESEVNGSFRAIVGFATDRALFYATGGLALAEIEHFVRGGNFVPYKTNTHVGLTAGAGGKFAFTDAVSGFVEYRFTNYEAKSHPAIPVGMGVIAAHTLDLHTHQVQAGFSIKLDELLSAGD